jgi:DNA-binding transcriptional MerR regulator
MISDTPAYNLKAVLYEANIKADVLRAWERRYGLPKPQRTAGGHRLYSQRDIEMIKWLMARQAEGLSISHAVELWREIEADSRDPLAESRPVSLPPALAPVLAPDSNVDTLRHKWLDACMSFNESAAEQVMNQAFSVYPVEMVISEVLQHGISDIGEMWYRGEATVQQEHFTSALAMRRLDTLISATPRPTRLQTVLTAGPPDEWHTFALLMLNVLLRRRGINVVYLGGNVPSDRLGDAIDTVQPNLVVMAAQQLTSAATLQRTALLLRQKGTQLAYGGRVFNCVPALRERIAGHFLGETIELSIHNIEQILYSPRPVPFVAESPSSHLGTVQEFKEKRGMIESVLIENLRTNRVPVEHLETANLFLGNELTAALELGDAAYLAADMEWIRTLMVQHNVMPERLTPYLMGYGHAVRKVMVNNPAVITNWMDGYILQKSQQ